MRYYFNIDDGVYAPDEVGTELPDLATARHEAARTAGALLAEQAEAFWAAPTWTVTVADDAGVTLFTLSLRGQDAAAPA